MPYKDLDERRAYARRYMKEWQRKRRQQFMAGKRCQDCGKGGSLQLHHRDPRTKLHNRIWTWCPERRELEIAKCDILCPACHIMADWRVRHPTAPAHFGPGVRYRLTRQGEKRWRAELVHNRKRFDLGTWAVEEDAHAACNRKRAEWAAD